MGSTMKNIITVLFLGCYSLVFTQFNTLTPKKVISNEILNEQESLQKQSAIKIEKKQKSIINKLFNVPTKKNLKKEIDSLKTLMLRYNVSRIEISKTDSKIDKDSLFLKYKKQSAYLEKPNTEKPIKKFDFIDEEESISKISMPLDRKIVVTSPFGRRMHPIFGTAKMHTGTDFKANYENVYAVLDGIVTAAGWDSGGGGNYIKVRHSGTFETSYLHLSETYYRAGESVKAGFIIAKSGNTGNSTGAHLHFSVTEDGKYINPIRFLNDLIKANNLIAAYYEVGGDSNIQY